MQLGDVHGIDAAQGSEATPVPCPPSTPVNPLGARQRIESEGRQRKHHTPRHVPPGLLPRCSSPNSYVLQRRTFPKPALTLSDQCTRTLTGQSQSPQPRGNQAPCILHSPVSQHPAGLTARACKFKLTDVRPIWSVPSFSRPHVDHVGQTVWERVGVRRSYTDRQHTGGVASWSKYNT